MELPDEHNGSPHVELPLSDDDDVSGGGEDFLHREDRDYEVKYCKGWRRSCSSKATREGKYCGRCANRRHNDEERRERDTLRFEAERLRRQAHEAELRLKRLETKNRMQAARLQLQEDYRRRAVLIQSQQPRALPPVVVQALPAPPPAQAAAPSPPPQQLDTLPEQEFQRDVEWLRQHAPHGGVTVELLRSSFPECARLSDKCLVALIEAAGVGARDN